VRSKGGSFSLDASRLIACPSSVLVEVKPPPLSSRLRPRLPWPAIELLAGFWVVLLAQKS